MKHPGLMIFVSIAAIILLACALMFGHEWYGYAPQSASGYMGVPITASARPSCVK